MYVWKVSGFDNNKYKVLDFPDADKAADILAMLNSKNLRLIKYMEENYNEGSRERILADRLRKNYRSDALIENHPVDTTNTSYTQNKGAILAYCLREKKSGNNTIHDVQIIEFVNFHEVAHIASISYGHLNEFWDNFEVILAAAVKSGIHSIKDYSNHPVNYCGLTVSYNPHFD